MNQVNKFEENKIVHYIFFFTLGCGCVVVGWEEENNIGL